MVVLASVVFIINLKLVEVVVVVRLAVGRMPDVAGRRLR